MLKRTTQEVAEHFKKEGYELLGEYLGAIHKMSYKCLRCNRVSEMNWNNFSRGKRCPYCGKGVRKKKYSLEEIQEIFSKRGCVFLDSEFKGIHVKHNYQCKCGRKAIITFAGFYHQNQYCHQCGLEKNKGSGHHDWIADREQKRLNDLFRKKCYKALRQTLLKSGQKKIGRTTDLLGYTPQQLQEYIKSHPNWEAIKDKNWHLDHVFPIIAFIEHGILDIKLINSLDNLQPLEDKENISKGDKYDKDKFLIWLKSHNVRLQRICRHNG